MNKKQIDQGQLTRADVDQLITELVDLSNQLYSLLNSSISGDTEDQMLKLINKRKDQVLASINQCQESKLDFYELLHDRIACRASDDESFIDELTFKFIFC